MSWHMVHLADAKATPWRNGGGLTRELVASPQGADWNWRMSVAEVGSSGPFSRFVGVTRWFAVLKGAGVALSVHAPADSHAAAAAHRLTCDDAPLCFDGGATTQCQLLNGPTQDFNLMVRDACLPARMVRVRGTAQELAHATKTIAVYVCDTGASIRFNGQEIQVPPATLVWRAVTKAATVDIVCADALWMELST